MEVGERVTVSEGKYVDEPGVLVSLSEEDDCATVLLDKGYEVRVWSTTPRKETT